jgi:hypothetical protein
MKLSKLLLATVGATVLLGALVASASARNFSVSNQNISAMWSSVHFTGPFGGLADCHLTLEGSLHSRTIAKVAGSLIGYITRAILGRCEAGTATIEQERLPWHISYSGFEGALPNITSIFIHVVGASFHVRTTEGITCHVLTTATEPARGILHRSTATHEITETGIEGRIRAGGECLNATGTLSTAPESSGAFSLLGTSNVRISVSLI